jgi:DNA-binding transcriptional LysR family regulator
MGLSFSGKRMRRLIFGIIIAGLAAIAAAAAVYYYEGRTVLRIAIPRDSDDQAIMAAAALDFAENRESIRLKLVAVENLTESSRALEEGHADLAIVRSDIAMPPSGQTVLIMRRNAPCCSRRRRADCVRSAICAGTRRGGLGQHPVVFYPNPISFVLLSSAAPPCSTMLCHCT